MAFPPMENRRVNAGQGRCSRVIIQRGNSEEESRERTHVCALTGWRSRDRNDSGESGRPSGKYIGPQGGGGSEEEGGGGPSTHPSAPVCTHTRAATHVFTHGLSRCTCTSRCTGTHPRETDRKRKSSIGHGHECPPFSGHLARSIFVVPFLQSPIHESKYFTCLDRLCRASLIETRCICHVIYEYVRRLNCAV